MVPEMNEKNKEDARKVYAMVSNIDDNIGRVLDKLDELGIEDNTIVIFMTDNGPEQPRYVGGMRGRKGSVYRGGVRVPFFLRYPAMTGVNSHVSTNAAHIDVLPTLAELCGVDKPGDRKIDGKSLVPLIHGEEVNWGDRPLFFYWTRKYPELYRNMAVQSGNFKLVGNTDFNSSPAQFELYNIEEDPREQINISKKETGIAEQLKSEIDTLYKELINSDNIINPPRIVIGSDFENPVILNRNDADGERGMWAQEEIFGFWRVKITGGSYKISFKFLHPLEPGGRMILETGAIINQQIYVGEDSDIIEFNYLKLPDMECDLIPFYQVGSKRIFPFWLEIEKL
jgi:arylsulfatase A-like enzyme